MKAQGRISVHFAVAGSAFITLSLSAVTAQSDPLLDSYVEISNGGELGTDQVDMSTGGWIRSVGAGTVSLVPEMDIMDGAVVRFSAIAGSDLNLRLYRAGRGAELHFGGAGDTGTVTLADNFFSGSNQDVYVDSGTLLVPGDGQGALLRATTTTVASGATIDLGTHSDWIASLAGSGTIRLDNANLEIRDFTFNGTIDGANSVTFSRGGNWQGRFLGVGEVALSANRTLNIIDAATAANLSTLDALRLSSGSVFDLRMYDASLNSLYGAGLIGTTESLSIGSGNYSGGIIASRGLTISGDFLWSGVSQGALSIDVLSGATLSADGGKVFGGLADINVDGTLAIKTSEAVDALTGGGSVDVAGNAVLSVGADNSSATFDGVISGDGGLTKAGTGTVTLSSRQSFTGVTTISAGTLQLMSANALSTSSGLFMNNGTQLDMGGFNQAVASLSGGGDILLGSASLSLGASGASGSFGGVISGSGSVTKSGTGTFGLFGPNSFSGAMNVLGGTLFVSSSASLGDGSATNTLTLDGATLQTFGTVSSPAARGVVIGSAGGTVNTSGNTVTFAGSVSGTGRLSKTGAGTLTLSGNNTRSGDTDVEQGRLSLQNGNALADDGRVTIADLAATGLDVETSETIGSLAGGGSSGGDVNLSNTATLNVGGDDSSTTFAGSIAGDGSLVKTGAGLFRLTGNSSYTGDTDVLDGTLSVNGSLAGAVNVGSGARLQGTGSVGRTSLAANSVLAPGNSIGTLTVAGDLNLDPSSVFEVEIGSTGLSDRVNVTGTAFLNGAEVRTILWDPAVSYVNGQSYTIVSAGAVSGTFGDLEIDSAFLKSFLSYSATDVTLTLRTVLSPGSLFPSAALTYNQQQSAYGLDFLDQTSGSSSLALYNAILYSDRAEARDAFDQLSGEIHASLQNGLFSEADDVRNAVYDRLDEAFATGGKAWTSAYGNVAWLKGDGNASSATTARGGALYGVDWVIDDRSIGVFAGVGQSSFEIPDLGSTANIDSVHLGLYAAQRFGGLQVRFGASNSWHDIETRRDIAFDAFSDSQTASYHGSTAQIFSEASYDFGLSRDLIVAPFGRLDYAIGQRDNFHEDGGAASLSGESAREDLFATTVGLRTKRQASIAGKSVTTGFDVAWRRIADQDTPLAALAFENGGSFVVKGLRNAENSVVAGGSVTLQLTEAAAASLSYRGQFGDGLNRHSANARLDVRF
ncbi:autotransporter domain-containing protein [Rhizobium binae]|uniref:autotransporter domain-containing protein n=1 Tax=Rhizobium binae TaxID=1138190 RepID=UPI001C836DB1|nr:autotransporter domain-containing protein [Rhizobium binae]MBX4952244.1 autotransporter domain-containing protein [Rhizobium binae]MBX4964006.1 autotransporter domain-containing protein [Rhizobium binae]MBX4970473.1 autotransporter domain-containing protein [Rhizobium binae]